jgi:hypothetical protein
VVRETPPNEPLFVQIVRFKDLLKNGGGEGQGAPAVEAFASSQYLTFASEPTFQAALKQAHADVLAAGGLGPKAHVPFSLIALASDNNHRYAGILDDDEDFSGSLMKVAAMYAAFELRAAALRFAKSKNFANEDEYFKELAKEFDPQIKASAVSDVRKVGIGLAPAYKNILKASALNTATPSVVLADDFKKTLYQSIAKSHNPSSAIVIRTVGYSYINAALIKAGLYDSGSQKGIWLAGDYGGSAQARIPAANDGTTAHGTTTKQMCRFFALIELKKLAGSDESKDMQDLLRATITEHERSWTVRNSNANFDLEYGKIGVAGLGRKQEGPLVYSDGLVVAWRGDAAKLAAKKLTGKIAICWQNLRAKEFKPPFDGVAEIVNKAYAKILT